MKCGARGIAGDDIAARVRLALLAAVLLALAAAPARAVQDEAAGALERRVKAALLYRFINYVEWPQSAFEEQPGSQCA